MLGLTFYDRYKIVRDTISHKLTAMKLANPSLAEKCEQDLIALDKWSENETDLIETFRESWQKYLLDDAYEEFHLNILHMLQLSTFLSPCNEDNGQFYICVLNKEPINSEHVFFFSTGYVINLDGILEKMTNATFKKELFDLLKTYQCQSKLEQQAFVTALSGGPGLAVDALKSPYVNYSVGALAVLGWLGKLGFYNAPVSNTLWMVHGMVNVIPKLKLGSRLPSVFIPVPGQFFLSGVSPKKAVLWGAVTIAGVWAITKGAKLLGDAYDRRPVSDDNPNAKLLNCIMIIPAQQFSISQSAMLDELESIGDPNKVTEYNYIDV